MIAYKFSTFLNSARTQVEVQLRTVCEIELPPLRRAQRQQQHWGNAIVVCTWQNNLTALLRMFTIKLNRALTINTRLLRLEKRLGLYVYSSGVKFVADKEDLEIRWEKRRELCWLLVFDNSSWELSEACLYMWSRTHTHNETIARIHPRKSFGLLYFLSACRASTGATTSRLSSLRNDWKKLPARECFRPNSSTHKTHFTALELL